MATIKYYIKKSGGEPILLETGLTTVYLKYVHNERHVLFSSGVRISPEQWAGDTDQSQPIRGTGRTTKLKALQQQRDRLSGIVYDLTYEKIDPAIEVVKQRWKGVRQTQQRSEKLLDVVDAYISAGRSTKNERTIKIAQRVRKDVEAYCKKKKLKPNVQDVNLPFYDGLQAYLLEDRGLSINSAGKYLQHFKAAMRWADKQEYPVSGSIRHFEVPTLEMPVVYLNTNEIEALQQYNFKSQRLNRVRDLWVLQASIGLRWSDLERLSKAHIRGDVIRMNAFKTGKKIIVPLSPRARGLLAKLNYSTTFISQQKFNE